MSGARIGARNATFTATASCGLCGKASIEAVRCLAERVPDSGATVSPGMLRTLNDQLRAQQAVFERTGGLHAAGLFDFGGKLLSLREDVGRHNAVDKLIGAEVLASRLPLSDRIMMVSGRVSFEILQKAAVARLPLLCAVSAPTSLAVDLARELNITLVGFMRGANMNVYSRPTARSALTAASHPSIRDAVIEASSAVPALKNPESLKNSFFIGINQFVN